METNTELVHYRVERAIATITLDSPANRNALSAPLVAQASAHLATAAGDTAVRGIVLTHTGRTFCAGADLKEHSTEGGPERGTRRMLELFRTVVELPKPVIARVDGHTRAGGVGLVGSCDIAVAGPQATFAFSEVRLGLAPSIISLTTLGRMSERAAARYYLTGEVFDAEAAERSGLVTAAVTDLDAEIAALGDALRACSPQGLAETKPMTTRATLAGFAQRGEQLREQSQRLFSSEEAGEGMRAFLDKRPPRWAVPEG